MKVSNETALDNAKKSFRLSWKRCTKLKCIPIWIRLSKKFRANILSIYLQCQLKNLTGKSKKKYVVDHIIPLQNPLVCGLHVPTNLAIITQGVNKTKGNIFAPYIAQIVGDKTIYKYFQSSGSGFIERKKKKTYNPTKKTPRKLAKKQLVGRIKASKIAQNRSKTRQNTVKISKKLLKTAKNRSK